jgi:hypothetical protein
MPQKSTPNQLIALFYNELEPEAQSGLMEELSLNSDLQQEFNDYAETISFLDKAELDANPTSIQLILEYSAKSQELQHA